MICQNTLKRLDIQIFVAAASPVGHDAAFDFVELLIDHDILVHHALYNPTLGAQLSVARELGINDIFIIGQKEAFKHTLLRRDLKERKTQEITHEEAIRIIQEIAES